jgi:hypothetical protein
MQPLYNCDAQQGYQQSQSAAQNEDSLHNTWYTHAQHQLLADTPQQPASQSLIPPSQSASHLLTSDFSRFSNLMSSGSGAWVISKAWVPGGRVGKQAGGAWGDLQKPLIADKGRWHSSQCLPTCCAAGQTACGGAATARGVLGVALPTYL